MAGIARYHRLSAEIALIDALYHQDHLACSLLEWGVGGILAQVVEGFCGMTLRAVQAERGGKEAHGPHEFVYRNPFEHLDVFEHLVRDQRLFWSRGLAARQHNT